MLPTFADEFSFTAERYDIVKKMYQEFSTKMSIRHLENILTALPTPTSAEDFAELRTTIYDSIITDLQSTLSTAKISGKEFLYYCSLLAPKYTNFNWGFAWSVLEDQIVALVPQGKTFCPIRTAEHIPGTTIEYLGEFYTLEEIPHQNTDTEGGEDLVNEERTDID